MLGANKYVEFLSVMDQCTDSYMYVLNLTDDEYLISEKALERFLIETNFFTDAVEVFKRVVYPPDLQLLMEDVAKLQSGESDMHDLEYRWYDRENNPIWISCKGKVVSEGEKKYLVGSITEVGKRNKYDNNTSLLSESILESDYVSLAKMDNITGFLLLLGVDNFKKINEKFGAHKGDKILADVARCITECIGEGQKAYRLKGDEFAVLSIGDGDTAMADAKELYKRIRSRIDWYIEMKDFNIFYTISAGAVTFDTSTDSLDYVFDSMRFALHTAKMNGRNTFSAYSREEYNNYIRKMDIQEELRRCIINDFEGFEVYYQPVVRADSKKLYGAEALIRWNSSVYGFMSPVEFIPLLEESALIIPLGKWIIEQAVMQCKEWMKLIPDFTMNINLSFVQILKSDILKDVLDCVDYHGIKHENIVFEATESGELESNNSVKNVLNSFNNNCFRLAIDDFGTGYSNLRYIRDMMFSIIKIDRMFVRNIDKHDDNYTLVKYIIEMAHSLNIDVCVEGVETIEELAKVVDLGADCIQGYYYGKPMTKAEFYKQFLMKDSGFY